MDGQAGKVKLTRAMLAAGVQVLHESGALAAQSSADAFLVQRILQAALAVRGAHRKNSPRRSKVQKIAVELAQYL